MTEGCLRESRNSIEDIWGPRTPYFAEWPARVDERIAEEPDKWVQSACVLCSNGCGLDIGVKDNRIVGVKGRAQDRVNKGRLGPKGLHGLTKPLVRKNGKLEESTWDEAMEIVVKKAKELRQKFTAHSVAFYTSGQFFLEEYYTLAVIGKAGLNTLHMDGNTRLCTATAAAAMRESFGSDGQPGSYTDIDYTACLFLVGHNVSATQTVLWQRILDRLDGPKPPKLIVVDPRNTSTAKRATIHLAPRIGTNMALLNGIQRILFHNDWIDHGFVSKHTAGVERLREKVEKYTPELVEEITGIPAKQLLETGEIIGTAESLLSTALQGVYQSNQATASACQINNINLLRGKIGKPGSGVLQMNGQPTAQNNREAGCDGEFPGFRNHENKRQMQEMADIWNIDLARVPHWNQPTHVQSLLTYIEQDSIQMLWVSGTNPLVSLPNLPRTRELLTKPGLFLVVQDIFLNETAAIADVVFPAAAWGEKTGCFTNVDRTVHISHKAIDPPGEAKSDLEIFVDFATRMDFRDKDNKPLVSWKTSEEAFSEWKRMSKGRPCDQSGLSYEKLTGGSGIQWPCNEKYPFGKERLFEDGVFFTDPDYCESFGHDLESGRPIAEAEYIASNPAGRAILKCADYLPPPEATSEEYPLTLSTGRGVYHFHTRTKTGRSKALNEAAHDPHVEICTEDAEKYGIQDGDDVIVESRRGQVEMVAKIRDIYRGQVFIPFHFGYFDSLKGKARAANELTHENWDPISKQPSFKGGAVRIRKADPAEVKIHLPEPQTKALNDVANNKPNANEVQMSKDRDLHLPYFLGATFESVEALIEVYKETFPTRLKDKELVSGSHYASRKLHEVRDKLQPFSEKYGKDKTAGHTVAWGLQKALFPERSTEVTAYDTLVVLHASYIYLGHLEGSFLALNPVSAALWDADFNEAVIFSIETVKALKEWTAEHVRTRSPQTLIVPGKAIQPGGIMHATGDASEA